MPTDADLVAIRARYAAAVLSATQAANARVEQAFANVPREAHLKPPPWTVFAPGALWDKQTSDPADLYEDALVVLDAAKGINNGQPSLHAAWIAAVDPQPGQTVIHVGAGSGYYTAILAELVAPGGVVHAYEVDAALAALARDHLADGRAGARVEVHAASAIGPDLPAADLVYVNAAVEAPDAGWLKALRPGGHLICPWQTSRSGCVTLKARRVGEGFRAEPWLAVGFIPCVGQDVGARNLPSERDVAHTHALWLAETRRPDASATAIYRDVWFSSQPIENDGRS